MPDKPYSYFHQLTGVSGNGQEIGVRICISLSGDRKEYEVSCTYFFTKSCTVKDKVVGTSSREAAECCWSMQAAISEKSEKPFDALILSQKRLSSASDRGIQCKLVNDLFLQGHLPRKDINEAGSRIMALSTEMISKSLPWGNFAKTLRWLAFRPSGKLHKLTQNATLVQT